MIWGYAHVWFNEFLSMDPEPQLARLKFVNHWGLRSTGLAAEALADLSDNELERLFEFVEQNDLVANLTYSCGIFTEEDGQVARGSRDEISRNRDRLLGVAEKCGRHLRTAIVCTESGPAHRFLHAPDLDAQMDALEADLSPVAEELGKMDMKLALENHGDYYVSDIVCLCERVDNLWLFLDTGNTYLIGERPLEAIAAGAPFAAGTHFKDQRVRPRKDQNPIHFEVAPAVTGEGDVPLREAYAILQEHATDPESLMMEIELIPPAGVPLEESMRRSVEFIRGLEGDEGPAVELQG